MSHHSLSLGTLHQNVDSSSSESLSFMMEQECTTYSCCDYLHGDGDGYDDSGSDDDSFSSSATLPPRVLLHRERVTSADRMKLTDWCYALVDRCQFQRETVAIAMNIVDRFMCAPCASLAGSQELEALHDRTKYQLVTIAALYISIKLNERTIFGSRKFCAASHGIYSLKDIEGMELKILHALSWRMCPPTSLQVGHQILTMMLTEEASIKLKPDTFDFLREEMAFQTENAVRDYSFSTQRPSTIAAAAIMNAIKSVGNRDYEYLTEALICILGKFSFESFAVLLEARNQLLRLTNEKKDEENDAVIVSERDRVPPSEEESRNVSVDEEALNPSDNNIYHSLMHDNFEQIVSSPRFVMSVDTWDDSSCATIY